MTWSIFKEEDPKPAPVPAVQYQQHATHVPEPAVASSGDVYGSLRAKTDFAGTEVGLALAKYSEPLAGVITDEKLRAKTAAKLAEKEGISTDSILATFDGLKVALQNEVAKFNSAGGQMDTDIATKESTIRDLSAQMTQLQAQITQLGGEISDARNHVGKVKTEFNSAMNRRSLEHQGAEFDSQLYVGEYQLRQKEKCMATKTEGAVANESRKQTVQVKAPDMRVAIFNITGTEPLVIHRFSAKVKAQMKEKMEEGKSAASKKNREPKSTDTTYEEARYIAKEGWDGFHAGSMRNAMISACRLVGFKMTLAKLSIFVIADGRDKKEPQIPLIRIYGDPIKQEDMARVETGQPYVTVRAAYHKWKARVQIRWDNDQFSIADISNLLARVGMQVGICEGRPDSKNSSGMGWGLFSVDGTPHETEIAA